MSSKTLLLLRHAEPVRSHPLSTDHDRPLSPRGHAQAETLGQFLQEEQQVPQRIICSSATRATETLQGLTAVLAKSPGIEVDRGLYGASPQSLLNTIQTTDDEITILMVIAHNPGVAALARALAAPNSAPREIETMRSGHGPGDLAVFCLGDTSWTRLQAGGARLLRHYRPPRQRIG